MHDVGVEKGEITADVASRLIAEQFPQWSHLAVTPVELDGWDNTTLTRNPSYKPGRRERAPQRLSAGARASRGGHPSGGRS
jgi:aminoglycoside phosphotransferase (APT) family kinase protein